MYVLGRTRTLLFKNLLVNLVRNPLTTLIQAFLLPVVLSVLFTVLRRLYNAPSEYGIGSVATPVRDLKSAFESATGNRDTLVFANSGFTNGDITRVIHDVGRIAKDAGIAVQVVEDPSALSDFCRSSIRGVTSCLGAAVFHSSPTESEGGRWNYTLRGDLVLGSSIYTDRADNDVEIYILPLQHAIDAAIAGTKEGSGNALPVPQANMYTSQSAAERREEQRLAYMNTIISALAAAFFTAMVGVTYHLGGFMASEREAGMSQLLDVAMSDRPPWQSQFSRLVSYLLSFTIMYLPGWILMGVLLGRGIFSNTALGIVIIHHILSGIAMTSFTIFAGAFFQNVQLSGNSISIVSLVLAVVANTLSKSSVGAVVVLSLLFPQMNYIFFLVLLARWERVVLPTNLVNYVPDGLWRLQGVTLWVFLGIQIFVYPVLGAVVENILHPHSSNAQRSSSDEASPGSSITVKNLSKVYRPSWFKKIFGSKEKEVLALNNVSLTFQPGQLTVLLGANGSGKTTLLNAVVGLDKVTSGQIEINGREGIGYTPQKNVLWDRLTVDEHVRIFTELKSPNQRPTPEGILEIVKMCDLTLKMKTQSKALSGGQKRKLQLALMLSGDSQVCCLDEVSSGLDPLSRRKIWDILLSLRGHRTIIMTTHFLDEAGLLADHVAILSQGQYCTEGSVVQLTEAYGNAYNILVPTTADTTLPDIEGVSIQHSSGLTTYSALDSATAAFAMQTLSRNGITDFDLKGPTMEDMFVNVIDEKSHLTAHSQEKTVSSVLSTSEPAYQSSDIFLHPGARIGVAQQAAILLQKRLTLLRRNFFPHVFAFIIPILVAGLITLLLKHYNVPGCSVAEMTRPSVVHQLSNQIELDFLVGPSSKVAQPTLEQLLGGNSPSRPNVHVVDSQADFDSYIKKNYANVTPGGFFLGDTPVFSYRGDGGIQNAVFAQNPLNTILSNQSINVQYAAFDSIVASNTGDAIQIALYLTLALMLFPAFFALYPTAERVSGVRALHYSNGIRALPLWIAYLTVDFAVSIAICAVVAAIFAGANPALYNVGYLFLILILYSLASTLFSYVISKVASTQLMAYAIVVTYQGVMVDSTLLVAHYAISIFSPITSVIRGLFLMLNLFSMSCSNEKLATTPGALDMFGGPILYLILQSIWLFAVLILSDRHRAKGQSSFSWKGVKTRETVPVIETQSPHGESAIVHSSDPVQVLSVSKDYGKTTAVDNLTFSVRPSEVFALIGPNGAGKSTTISLILGDISPNSKNGGDIIVASHNIANEHAAAQAFMGICPQFDALDTLTVNEHLRLYARVRGVQEVDHNVSMIIHALDLQDFTHRIAKDLSGGNKRKLSLGIALVGNPQVLLLDEPSSGMDPLSKRAVWRTLRQAVVGRSLLLTTHSMEEAAALAGRVGIVAQRMLAVGNVDTLRKAEGLRYYVHCILRGAPWVEDHELETLRRFIEENLPGAEVEERMFHGQIKFSVPMERSSAAGGEEQVSKNNTVTALFQLLEDNKERLKLYSYSVNGTTLDEVFLSIVGRNDVQEEGAGEEYTRKKTWWEVFKGY